MQKNRDAVFQDILWRSMPYLIFPKGQIKEDIADLLYALFRNMDDHTFDELLERLTTLLESKTNLGSTVQQHINLFQRRWIGLHDRVKILEHDVVHLLGIKSNELAPPIVGRAPNQWGAPIDHKGRNVPPPVGSNPIFCKNCNNIRPCVVISHEPRKKCLECLKWNIPLDKNRCTRCKKKRVKIFYATSRVGCLVCGNRFKSKVDGQQWRTSWANTTKRLISKEDFASIREKFTSESMEIVHTA